MSIFHLAVNRQRGRAAPEPDPDPTPEPEPDPPPSGGLATEAYAGQYIGALYSVDSIWNTNVKNSGAHGVSTAVLVKAYRPMAIKRARFSLHTGTGYSNTDKPFIGARLWQWPGSINQQPTVILADTGIIQSSKGAIDLPFNNTVNLAVGDRVWYRPYNTNSLYGAQDNYKWRHLETSPATFPQWIKDQEADRLFWNGSDGNGAWQERFPNNSSVGIVYGMQGDLADANGNPLWGYYGFDGGDFLPVIGGSNFGTRHATQFFKYPYAVTIDQIVARWWKINDNNNGGMRVQVIRDSDGVVMGSVDIPSSEIDYGLPLSSRPVKNIIKALPSPIALAANTRYRARMTGVNSGNEFKANLPYLMRESKEFWPFNSETYAQTHDGSTQRTWNGGLFLRRGLNLAFRRSA